MIKNRKPNMELTLYGEVERKTRIAVSSHEETLYAKRDRLREMLHSETEKYREEWTLINEREEKQKTDEEAKRLLELQTMTERERLENVQQQNSLRKVLNCEQARPIFVKKGLEQLKKDQKCQILEKAARMEDQQLEEKIFHTMMLETVKTLSAVEEEKKQKRWMQKKENMANYLQQLHWKTKQQADKGEEKFQDEERVRTDIMLNEQEKERELQERKKRVKKTADDLKLCLTQEREMKEQRKRQEQLLDERFLVEAQKEAMKTKSKHLEQKEKFQRDMKIFLDHSSDMRHKRENEEHELNDTIREWNSTQEKQKEEERIKLKVAKEQLFSSVLRGREIQIQEKLDKMKKKGAEKAKEVQEVLDEVAHIKKLEQEEAQKMMAEKREYANFLKYQMQKKEEKKKQETMEKQKYLESLRAEEAEMLKEISTVAKTPLSELSHPLKLAVLKNVTPNYLYPLPCPK